MCAKFGRVWAYTLHDRDPFYEYNEQPLYVENEVNAVSKI